MSHYGKQKELAQLMRQWIVAVHAAIEQGGKLWLQLDPVTGELMYRNTGGYSPLALVYLDFMKRLNGHFPAGPGPRYAH
jgi:hypothetical protein